MEDFCMLEFRARITTGGRITIPAKCREALNFSIGDEIILKIVDDEMHIYSLKHALKHAQTLIKQRNKKKMKLTSMLIKERRAEAKNE